MPSIPDVLAASSLFKHFEPASLVATERLWLRRSLEPWQVLWSVEAAADELAVVETGQLEVLVDDRSIATLGAGEVVGEASALVRGETRTASVRALRPTRLLVLGQAGIAELRERHHDVYDALVERALVVMAERVNGHGERIARLARTVAMESGEGAAAPSSSPRAALESRWPRAAESRQGDARAVLPALRLLPVLMEARDELLLEIALGMRPRKARAGEALFLQGDRGASLFVVVEGSVDVLRLGPSGGYVPLTRLGPGALIGTGAVILGGVRSASCVAATDVSGFEIDAAGIGGLGRETRRTFREALLCALRVQILESGKLFSKVEAGRAARFGGDLNFTEMLRGAAVDVAWGGDGMNQHVELAAVAPSGLSFSIDPQKERLLEYIRNSIIGADEALETPYGCLRVTYADYTASGRCLSFVEDFIRDEVMPTYANTHTEASGTGRQTTRYREDAREIIRQSVNAGPDDAVIFVGSGATGAINKLVDILNLRIPSDLDARYRLSERIPPEQRPVVFVGPYEHHSNELPWRHSIADVVVIDDDDDGRIDLRCLERELIRYADRPLKIGSFSAASNVSGIVADTDAVAIMLHLHGALSFWDYAAAGPYTRIDMNGVAEGPNGALAYKDAVFVSPHKFIGGPGSPGLLVVKRTLATNTVPTQPGGGTVSLVTPQGVLYWGATEHREEGGTPAIIESIRCGMAFHLKRSVGIETISAMEHALVRRAIETWAKNPNLRIIGNPDAERLSIVSFMVRYRHHYVHNNFIVTLLNDLFGIQARGGCSCAGPYMHRLLGLSASTSLDYYCMVDKGFVSLKPGWARVNFNYFISEQEFEYVVAAVNLVALWGHALLPDYEFDLVSGQWHHRKGQPHRPMRLSDVRFSGGRMEYPSRHVKLPESELPVQLEAARTILSEARARVHRAEVLDPPRDDEYEKLRWFTLPGEVVRDFRAATTAEVDPRLATYQAALVNAYASGHPSPDAIAVLKSLRSALRITPEEHVQVTLAASEG